MRAYSLLVANHPLANITFVMVLLLGLLGYQLMPREQDPEINFNWVNITTVLPGASAEDVEKQITNPLEDAIKSVPDVRYVQSSSRENVSSVLVRFREMNSQLFDKRINDLRREVQAKADSEFPTQAKAPQVLEITTSNGFPTAQVVLVGRADDENLRSLASSLRDDMERLTGVDRVYAVGLRDPELRVEFDPRALAARRLTGADVADSVSGWFRDVFAGRASAGGTGTGTAAATIQREWLVRLLGERLDPNELAKITVLGANGSTAPLDAVARVSRERSRAGTLAGYQGRPAVVLSVTKKSYTNTLTLLERVNGFIAEKNPLIAARGVQLLLLDDQTVPTREAIRIMETNALVGLMLVLAVCWVFLGTRIAFLVGIGIPFALAGAFVILYATGSTLNVSVLLGVVIVLGMLVDDVVVVVETIYYRMERGEAPFSAAVQAVQEVFAPVISSVGTTLAAFLPLMLLPGILGKFIFVIPFVVTVALLISLIEAFWMLPAHISAMKFSYAKPSRVQRWRTRFNRKLRSIYSRALIKVMRHPIRALLVLLLLFSGAAASMALGWIKVQFFAFDPLRVFYVNVDMPPGTPIENTLKRMTEVAARAETYLRPGEARGVATYAGIKFTDTEPLYGDSYAQVVISLNPRLDEMRGTPDVVAAMRSDLEKLPGPGLVSFTQLSGGPPAGKPIKVNVRADDFNELRAAADALKGIIRKHVPGAHDVVDDEVPGRPELVLRLDPDAVRASGLSPALIARILRLHVDGEIVVVTRDLREKLELRVRAQRDPGLDIAAVLDDPLALPQGGSTTLRSLMRVETRTSRGVIKHYGLKRSVTVTSDLDKTVTDTGPANDILKAEWAKIRVAHPNADLDFSGELDDLEEALDSMKLLFLLGVGLIYMILAAQFRSYFQPMMILMTVPMAFTGVAAGLLISGNPMSLYTLYGVIALTGIAVNSAIVLIDAANRRMAAGMSALHAAIYAARRRIVPIIITTATTVGGLSALAFGIGGESLLWQPVAGAIVWGLSIATMMTAFIVPLLYRLAMGRSRKAKLEAAAVVG